MRYALGVSVTVLLIAWGLTVSGCDSSSPSADAPAETKVEAAKALGVGKPAVEIAAAGDHESGNLRFELSTDEVPYGWTTLSFENLTHSDHFFLLYKVPQAGLDAAETAGEPILQHWYLNITAPFQAEWDKYVDPNAAPNDFNDFAFNYLFPAVLGGAPWFPAAQTMGGPGFLAPGQKSATTVYLEPGIYIAECYVKSEGEQFHSYSEPGQPRMLSMLTVTEEPSRAKEPRATMEVSISQPDPDPNEGGMQVEDQVRPGLHTVAVHFGEQPQFGYAHLLGHNAQLVRLKDAGDTALLDELGAWMDWTQIGAFTHGSPAGSQFVGGAMEMAGGSVAYVHVNLSPGDYAWIAEVPDPAGKGMLKTFTVPYGRGTTQPFKTKNNHDHH